jgi:small subunit ribosomal protein S3
VIEHFIEESVKKAEVDEFLQKELENAGYSGIDITRTPLGTHVVVHVIRPGVVIGRGGSNVKKLANILEETFGLSNPQISVAEIEIPELDAHVIASRIASALTRGVHYRRTGYWALNKIMEAGALGAEIVISGKLRSQRHRYEKFREGYLPKSGETAKKYLREAVVHVQLKPGVLGVKVRIMPPDAQFADDVQILEGEKPEKKVEHVEKAAPIKPEVEKEEA